jgi:hypothetical protein
MTAARSPRLRAVTGLCSPVSPAGGPSSDAAMNDLSAADAPQSESMINVFTTRLR